MQIWVRLRLAGWRNAALAPAPDGLLSALAGTVRG
jgi:hypothetical protein